MKPSTETREESEQREKISSQAAFMLGKPSFISRFSPMCPLRPLWPSPLGVSPFSFLCSVGYAVSDEAAHSTIMT